MSGKKKRRREALQVLRPQVAGIDLGSREHWACGPPREGGEPNVRTFGTTTRQLRELADWLAAEGVESVAMESTYVYWIPLHELLEERGFEVLLVNARQLKNVPGRKTDMHDCLAVTRPTQIAIVEIVDARAGHVHVVPASRRRNATAHPPSRLGSYRSISLAVRRCEPQRLIENEPTNAPAAASVDCPPR